MQAKAAWMDVDRAEELTLTIGIGDVFVEIATQIVMDIGDPDTGTLTAMERGVAVARLIAMERGVAVARLTAMERGVAVARLTAMEHGVAVARLTAMEGRVAVTDSEDTLCVHRYASPASFREMPHPFAKIDGKEILARPAKCS